LRIGAQVDHAAPSSSADSATQLVQVGKAETVRAPDQHGVGARDVQPGFDDVGGQQYVMGAVSERHHCLV
jgi:hypothetical protein